ncbi:MAG: hypothetical protein CM15mP73_1240 [Hyphomicrobiales bacterium]|nr:MAG: hypothetical protein CM15mP73_1240 [Hyphomicrobiales bacterium]
MMAEQISKIGGRRDHRMFAEYRLNCLTQGVKRNTPPRERGLRWDPEMKSRIADVEEVLNLGQGRHK